jgi:NHLM bacteriocin system ABC transporter ATP-binding protein
MEILHEVPKISSELFSLFTKSELIRVPSNTHFFLDEPNTVWWVEGDGGDLFLVDKDHPNFIPAFVLEILPGELLFSSGIQKKAQFSFFLLSPREISLRKLSLTTLISEIHHSFTEELSFVKLFDRWVGRLLSLLLPQNLETATHFFKLEDEVHAETEEILALEKPYLPEDKDKIVWFEIREGVVELQGEVSETLTKEQKAFPLILSFTIQATSSLTATSLPTEKVLLKPDFVEILTNFHDMFFSVFARKKQKHLEATLAKMQKKRVQEEEQYSEAFYKLGSVLNPNLTAAPTQEGSSLLKACDLIGQQMGIKMNPATSRALSPEEEVREICSNSNIYFRRVSLKKQFWWKRGVDSMLAFRKSTGAPVALILTKKREYQVVDPVDKTTVQASSALAEDLEENAYVFYAGFSSKIVRFRDFLYTVFKRNRHEFFTLIFVAIAGGILNLFTPFAMQTLFDAFTFGQDFTLLTQLTFGLLLVAFSGAIFAITKNYAILRIEGISKIQITASIWSRVLSLPAFFFRKVSSGNLMNNMMFFEGIRAKISANAVKICFDVAYCFFYLILMFYYSLTFTGLGIGLMFLAMLIYSGCIWVQLKLMNESVRLSSVIQGIVVQIISGIPKIRVAGAESRFFAKWGDLFSQKKRIDMKIQYASGIQSLVFRLFPMVSTAVLFSVALLIFTDQAQTNLAGVTTLPISLGTFIGFNTAYSLFITSCLEIYETCFALSVIIPNWKQAKFIVEEPTEAKPERVQSVKLKGEVVLDHVSFRYNKEGDWTVHDINLVANPGEMVAVVGPSGCGKSTLVRMLLGFEVPEIGEVLYDDIDLKDLDLRQVRRQTGVVLQNAGVLAGSLYDNIVGAGTYTPEQIERAIKLSAFDQDLAHLPMGLSTILPMGGSSFSGGQRQRLYLARALISSPKILILDEATSALDNRTQETVSANLEKIEVTRIVIAHRLSTIMHADRIYVMDAGRVIEVGTFQELVEKNGLFAEMLKRQKL